MTTQNSRKRRMRFPKEDRYGLLGVLFCGMMATYDVRWRGVWGTIGLGLAIWTAVSLTNRWFRSR